MTPRIFNPTRCAECVSLRLEIDDLAAKLNQLTAQVTSQVNQLTALEGTVLIDWIRNVIASILLVLAGEQPYPSSNRMQKATSCLVSHDM